MDNLQVKTLAELREAASTIKQRLYAAAMSGDAKLRAELLAEKAALPTLLFWAEVEDLQRQIVDVRAELVEAKSVLQQEGAKTVALQEAVREAQKQLEVQRRASGLAKNGVDSAKEELRRLENKLETIIAQQAYAADVESAPVVRNLIGRVPGPAVWPR